MSRRRPHVRVTPGTDTGDLALSATLAIDLVRETMGALAQKLLMCAHRAACIQSATVSLR